MTDLRHFIPPPGAPLICDFCGVRYPTHTWKAMHFGLTGTMSDGTELIDNMEWIACDDCNRDLKAGNWETITERSTVNFIKHHPMEFKIKMKGDRELLKQRCRVILAAFRGEVPGGIGQIEREAAN